MLEVSVVMGTYNDAEVLAETLDSVLRQTFLDFEFIIVDDGTSDSRARKIIAEYDYRHHRVRVISKENEGLTCALIDGCAAARGEYIARVDAGDAMHPRRLAAQISVLQKHADCVFVSCWTEFFGPQWEPLWMAKGAPAGDRPRSVLSNDFDSGLECDVPHHGSVMFRRSAYLEAGGYRPEFYYGQDWDLWYRLAELGGFAVLPEPLYAARIFPDSISMTRKELQDEAALCSLGAFAARRQGLDESTWLARAAAARPGRSRALSNRNPAAREHGNYFVGEALRRRGDVRCRKYFIQGIRHAPIKPRNYLRLLQSAGILRNHRPESAIR